MGCMHGPFGTAHTTPRHPPGQARRPQTSQCCQLWARLLLLPYHELVAQYGGERAPACCAHRHRQRRSPWPYFPARAPVAVHEQAPAASWDAPHPPEALRCKPGHKVNTAGDVHHISNEQCPCVVLGLRERLKNIAPKITPSTPVAWPDRSTLQ